MINFDSLTLHLFAKEAESFFVGAKIQKVQQPNRSELIFHIRNNGESRKFYINFNPNFYHLCFMSKQTEETRNITIPKVAPMFCMLLRKYIQNSKIVKIDVPKYERIFEIYFEYFDELNERSLLCLAIELMGKHSNVILYNYDTNVIIGCAHNVSSEKSRERELAGMLPYIYPPKQKKKNLLRVSFDSFYSELDTEQIIHSIVRKYNYFTVPIVSRIVESLNEFSYKNLYYALVDFLQNKDYIPSISSDFFEFSLFEIKESIQCNSINEMIDKYFSYHQIRYLFDNLQQKISKLINSQLKKLYVLKEKQLIQVRNIDKALEYKKKADIIMSNLYYIQKGASFVNLFDFEGNEIKIELDSELEPKDNANKFYSLYKKCKSANEHAQNLLMETNSQILFYEEQLFFVKNAEKINELSEIYLELTQSKTVEKDEVSKIHFVEFNGYKIYVGKNKKQNDYILSKLSSAEDLWFHPLNAAGSHVLVKNNNKDILPDEVLLKAAQITKEYSSQKDNSKTSIIYTKRKYVKKANNKLAFVTYKNESEIIV